MPSTAPTAPRPLATWRDFIALDDDDRRELIDGELIEVEVPNEPHEHVAALLIYFLQSWIRPRKAGRLLASGYKIRVGEHRGMMPDLQFYATDNPAPNPLPAQGLQGGRPDLAVEIISPGSRRYDRVIKLNSYAAIGVPEYWIVDPEVATLERLVLNDGGLYITTHALAGDVSFDPPSFPGLAIPLGELWDKTR